MYCMRAPLQCWMADSKLTGQESLNALSQGPGAPERGCQAYEPFQVSTQPLPHRRKWFLGAITGLGFGIAATLRLYGRRTLEMPHLTGTCSRLVEIMSTTLI
jgi:hypothetical protein